MRGVFSIALLNFKEGLRNKFFIGVAFFLIFYLLFCSFLGKLSVGETEKVLRDTGLVGIEITAIFLVIFSIIFSFYQEKNTKILEFYLSNFKKTTYLTGKLIGYGFLSLFYIFLAGLVLSLILSSYKAFNFACLIALYPMFLKILIVMCLSLTFSCLFSSPIIALFSSFFLFFASQVCPSALELANKYGKPFQKTMIKAIYHLLPNMDKLDIKYLAVRDKLPSLDYFLFITLYVLVYIVFLWSINVVIFRNKEY